MTVQTESLYAMLAADADRRAATRTMSADFVEHASHADLADLRFRLVNAFPRETRPAFAAMREMLEPYGYTLSPLHPGMDLRQPRMLSELSRVTPDDAPQFAPLVFELDCGSGQLRAFVRQVGGRPVPEFTERKLDLTAPANLDDVRSMLQSYVICMLRPLQARAAA